MAITIIDSYSEDNYSGAIDGLGAAYTTRHFQTFTNTLCVLEAVWWYALKGGSPTGSVYAKIYKHTGTYGTNGEPYNPVLATSDAVDVSTILGGIDLVQFTFSGANRIVLNEQYYCVSIEYTGGNGSNYLATGIDNTSPTHSGNPGAWNGTEWYSESGKDRIFYVYGTEITAWGPFPVSFNS